MNGNKDTLRSPLAKRKKLAADRTGASRLKDSISANDLVEHSVALTDLPKDDLHEEEEDEDEDEEEIDDGDLDDDFLAGALEEEWG